MEYKYGCLYRPAMPGAVPSSGLESVRDVDKTKTGVWSVCTYSRDLTTEEIEGFEMVRVDYSETVTIPPINYDPDVFFAGTKEEQKAYRRACVENMRAWSAIINNPRFAALEFVTEIGNKYILHHSTRDGIDFQLSSIAPDGFANCHTDYTFENKRQEVVLYQDLLEKVERNGATVRVVYF